MTQAQAEGALDGQEVRVQVLRHPQDGALHGEAARAHPPGAQVQVQGGEIQWGKCGQSFNSKSRTAQ